jgi:hypothetical protein
VNLFTSLSMQDKIDFLNNKTSLISNAVSTQAGNYQIAVQVSEGT